MGRFTPKIYNRKKPATVGGRTNGNVRMPSQMTLNVSFFRLTTAQAANSPIKNVMKIDRLAVFMEIKIGDQSI